MVAIAVSGLIAPAAYGQEPPTADPNSPSGLEYKIPLPDARQTGQPKENASAPQATASPDATPELFGSGIKASPPASAGGGSATSAGGGSATATPGTRSESGRSREVRKSPTPQQEATAEAREAKAAEKVSFADSSAPTGLFAGGAVLAVLLVGGAIYVLLAARGKRAQDPS